MVNSIPESPEQGSAAGSASQLTFPARSAAGSAVPDKGWAHTAACSYVTEWLGLEGTALIIQFRPPPLEQIVPSRKEPSVQE